MTDERDKSLDVLGIKPIGESVLRVTDGAMAGASAFLSRICLPAAEEFGLLLRDRVSAWRTSNAVEIANKASRFLESERSVVVSAPPRIIFKVLEEGSWAEHGQLQDMWAGLLASSCSAEGGDDSNLMFVTILSQLTASQTALLDHVCSEAPVYLSPAGWLQSDTVYMGVSELRATMAVEELHRLDRELDHLRSLQLIEGGFDHSTVLADVTPTPLCLHFFARCKGFPGTADQYFKAVMREESLQEN